MRGTLSASSCWACGGFGFVFGLLFLKLRLAAIAFGDGPGFEIIELAFVLEEQTDQAGPASANRRPLS